MEHILSVPGLFMIVVNGEMAGHLVESGAAAEIHGEWRRDTKPNWSHCIDSFMWQFGSLTVKSPVTTNKVGTLSITNRQGGNTFAYHAQKDCTVS